MTRTGVPAGAAEPQARTRRMLAARTVQPGSSLRQAGIALRGKADRQSIIDSVVPHLIYGMTVQAKRLEALDFGEQRGSSGRGRDRR
ncbi:hypothetical protein [Rhodomicrobium lacus]|uniref:hypothetical protein n=1 Tax=Rhodomicrobium lacus TaxID=2498452 RepID=UPI000F8DDAFC|nr:hypothetical protein [Rhodomicrobium lacus]